MIVNVASETAFCVVFSSHHRICMPTKQNPLFMSEKSQDKRQQVLIDWIRTRNIRRTNRSCLNIEFSCTLTSDFLQKYNIRKCRDSNIFPKKI